MGFSFSLPSKTCLAKFTQILVLFSYVVKQNKNKYTVLINHICFAIPSFTLKWDVMLLIHSIKLKQLIW